MHSEIESKRREREKQQRPIEIRHGRYRSVLSAFSNPRHGGTYLFIWVAAVVVVLTGISYAVYHFNDDLQRTAATVDVSTTNEAKTITLSDGSEVILEPSSSIRYPEEFPSSGERIVDFRGEGLFEVIENPEQPFVVHTGSVTATVFGTRFRIDTSLGETEFHVLEGDVLLTTQTQKLELESNEKVVYIEATHEFKEME